MMITKKVIFATLLLLVISELRSQDALFSQFHNTPNLLNPAILSIQDASLKIDLNYREHGRKASGGRPLTTFQVLANYAHSSFKSDRISYGVSVLNDKGGIGHIGSNMAHLHFAYLKKLTGKYSKVGAHYIGLGTSLGAGQKMIDAEHFWFGNQFNEEYNFIELAKNPEEDFILMSSNGRSNVFTDINAGITWYANLNAGLSANAGFSLYHLERANISLFDGITDMQRIRYGVHGSVNKSIGSAVTLIPRIAFTNQGATSQLMVGSELAIDNKDDQEFVMKFGAFGRLVSSVNGARVDAVVLTLNFGYEDFVFGVGYDLIFSSLVTQNNSRSAWEFRLGYTVTGSKSRRNTDSFRF